MTCTCIAGFDAQLDGQKLDTTIALSRDLHTMSLQTYTPLIRLDTDKPENRRSKPRMAGHKFCPFCGVEYRAATARIASKEARHG